MKCSICSLECETRRSLSRHVSINHKDTLKTKLAKELAVIHSIFTKEEITVVEQEYVNGLYAISTLPIDIGKYLTLSGVKRTHSEEKKTSRYKKKFTNTMQRKYSVDNPSQLEKVKDKKIATLISNYGDYNNTMSKQVELMQKGYMVYTSDTARISKANLKRDATVQKRYNVNNVSQIPFVRKKISTALKLYMKSLTFTEKQNLTLPARKAVVSRGGGLSKPELKVRESLDLLNIKYTTNQFLFGFNYDMVLPDNILLEVNGDMWHANPKFYKHDDLIMGKLLASDLWDKDRRKRDTAKYNNYTVIYVWEHETKTTHELLSKLIKKRIDNA